MSEVLDMQVQVKESQEEILMWSRLIRFEWTAPGEDIAQTVVVKLYHSDFDGYEIDWSMSDYPKSFRDLIQGRENELGEILDGLTWDFANE